MKSNISAPSPVQMSKSLASWCQRSSRTTSDLAAFNSLQHFLFNVSRLQTLDIFVPQGLGIDSLIDFAFCGASAHGVWQDIRSVKVEIWLHSSSESEASHLLDQTVNGHQPRYERWWKSFTVTKQHGTRVNINASM